MEKAIAAMDPEGNPSETLCNGLEFSFVPLIFRNGTDVVDSRSQGLQQKVLPS